MQGPGPRVAGQWATRWSAEGIAGGAVLSVVLIAALGAGIFGPHPYRQDLGTTLLPPGAGHPFGTDPLGRDLWSRVLLGLRVSITVAVIAAAISLTLGVTLGMTSGFYGGALGAFIMRLADIQLAVPFILLTLLIVSVLGANIRNLTLVMGVTGWVTYARVSRGQTLAVRHQEYVDAARAVGARDGHIIGRHILPNIGGPLLVVLTLDLSRLVLLEGAMSFLGFGVQPPTPSLGSLLSEGLSSLALAWWPVTFPGLTLAVFVLGVNLFGDWLSDHMHFRTNP